MSWPLLGAEALEADLAGEQGAVGGELAAERLGAALQVGGGELADLGPVGLEQPPSRRRRRLAGVLTGEEAARPVGDEADLAVDVAPAVGAPAPRGRPRRTLRSRSCRGRTGAAGCPRWSRAAPRRPPAERRPRSASPHASRPRRRAGRRARPTRRRAPSPSESEFVLERAPHHPQARHASSCAASPRERGW